MDFFQFDTVTEVLNTQMLLKLLLRHELLGLDFMIHQPFWVVFFLHFRVPVP